MSEPLDAPSYARIRALAIPAILANAAVPLLGLVDTAVIARVGTAADLGAVGLGTLVFNSLYWSLGFLRMSTTGLVAQAAGAKDDAAMSLAVGRAMVLGILLGLCALLLRTPVTELSLALLEGSTEVNERLRGYLEARMWGAPATLVTFVASGALIGLGKMRTLLVLQLALNGLNAVFDVVFVLVLGWGVRGLGLGTALAENLAALGSVAVLARLGISPATLWVQRQALRDRAALLALGSVNGHLFLRTLALLLGFAWFTRAGARLGDTVLASNYLLQQLVSFCAFFLDGIAFVAESFAGRAFGANDRALFVLAVRRTSIVAALVGLGLSLSLWLVGGDLVAMLAPPEDVAVLAKSNLPFAAIYVLLAVAAWQLDGVFIGATRGRELRDASVLSLLTFLFATHVLEARYGNTGLWSAMLVYAAARGATLAALLPRLLGSLSRHRVPPVSVAP